MQGIHITSRQHALMAEGLAGNRTTAEVAAKLGCGQSTVERHYREFRRLQKAGAPPASSGRRGFELPGHPGVSLPYVSMIAELYV